MRIGTTHNLYRRVMAKFDQTLLGTESSIRRSLTPKIDGLVALSIVLGSMFADEIVSVTSPWDDPEFKLAV